jgi:hypothetical protein
MFQALLAHLQEVLHKRRLVYCVRVNVSWLHQEPLQTWWSQLTCDERSLPSTVCVPPSEEEQVMLVTCRGP